MQTLFRAWWWSLGGVVFFTVFAFALNNREVVTVHWFFGYQSQIQLALLVLLTLMAGVFLGALAVLPLWWQQYRISRADAAGGASAAAAHTSLNNPSPHTASRLPSGQGAHSAAVEAAGGVDAV